MVKPINPAWHGTLEFLAGMVNQDKAEEIVEEASRNYFERKNNGAISAEVLGEMDLAYRIMSDQNLSGKKKLSRLLDEVPQLMNKEHFRNLSEKTQNFMLEYTQKTMPDIKKSKWKAQFVIPLLVLSAGLGAGVWWYYRDSSLKEEALLRVEGTNLASCEEHYFQGNHDFAQKCLTEIMNNSDQDQRKRAYQRLLNISISRAEYGGIDKLIQELTKGEFPSSKIFRHEWGQVFLYQRDYKHALQLFFAVEETRKDNPYDICWTWHEIGNVYLRRGEYDKAQEYYDKASTAYEKVSPDMKEFLGWHYQKLGYFSFLNGRNKEAEDYLEKSLHIFTEERKDKVGEAWTLHHKLLYGVSTHQSNYDDIGKKTLRLFEELHNPEGIAWTNYQLARGILRNAEMVRTALKGQSKVVAPKDYFSPLERIDEAKRYLSKSLEGELNPKSPEGLANIYLLMGEAELYSGNLPGAAAAIQMSFDYINKSNYAQKGNFKDGVMVLTHGLKLLEQIPEHSTKLEESYRKELKEIKQVIGTEKFELLTSELDKFGVIS
ncbi:tetratricopeptide repeat protein [Candidatus Woesearchaeota archaeon]|nr:tetratricopeptide repeat protein [Candidatus Woesearchaeota archaeon]